MADFLAEVYTPKLDGGALAKLVARLKAVAETMSAETPVTYLRSIHVPEDEACFHLFEAESAEVVYEAGRRAGLTFDRVAAAVEPVTSEGGAR
jgi:Protein of unknown function (DUF4242)